MKEWTAGQSWQEKDIPPVAILRFIARILSVVMILGIVIPFPYWMLNNFYCSYQLEHRFSEFQAHPYSKPPLFMEWEGEGDERKIGYQIFLGPATFRILKNGRYDYGP